MIETHNQTDSIYPPKSEYTRMHDKATEKLETLRQKIGDENFIKLLMGVTKICGHKDADPVEIANMCERCPKLLLVYLDSYIKDIKRRSNNEEVDLDDNLLGWMRIMDSGLHGDKPE